MESKDPLPNRIKLTAWPLHPYSLALPSFLLIQLSGRISVGRAGCGTDLARCVSVAGFFLRPQGAFPPGYYSLQGGWVDHPAPVAPLIRGMATGPSAFLGNVGRVWATALHPDPPKKKALCHTFTFGGV